MFFISFFMKKKLIKYRELPPKLQTILLRGFLSVPLRINHVPCTCILKYCNKREQSKHVPSSPVHHSWSIICTIKKHVQSSAPGLQYVQY